MSGWLVKKSWVNWLLGMWCHPRKSILYQTIPNGLCFIKSWYPKTPKPDDFPIYFPTWYFILLSWGSVIAILSIYIYIYISTPTVCTSSKRGLATGQFLLRGSSTAARAQLSREALASTICFMSWSNQKVLVTIPTFSHAWVIVALLATFQKRMKITENKKQLI